MQFHSSLLLAAGLSAGLLSPSASTQAPATDAAAGGSVGTVASTVVVHDPSAAKVRGFRRSAAATQLEDVQRGETPTTDALRAAGQAAIDILGMESLMSARIRRAIKTPEMTAEQLMREWRMVASDLRFEPVNEADVPVGFPPVAPIGEVVLKKYPSYRMARASMKGGNRMGPFFSLFNHIKDRDIPMTAPVQMDYQEDPERAPVPVTMAFLYANPEQGPTMDDGTVEVIDVPAAMAISMGGRGNPSSRTTDEMKGMLEAWLTVHPEYEAAGPERMMSYNGPSVRGRRRFFEVEMPVRLVAAATKTAGAAGATRKTAPPKKW